MELQPTIYVVFNMQLHLMTIELFAPLKNLFQVEFNVDEDRKKEKTEEIS